MSGRIFGYTFGRVPTWLLDAAVSDRAIRLFALLTRYADREGRGFPGRRVLAERLRCSVDSLDRALRELVSAGALRVDAHFGVSDQPVRSKMIAWFGVFDHPEVAAVGAAATWSGSSPALTSS